MRVELCKKSVERLVPDLAPLLSALRDREYAPVVKDCSTAASVAISAS